MRVFFVQRVKGESFFTLKCLPVIQGRWKQVGPLKVLGLMERRFGGSGHEGHKGGTPSPLVWRGERGVGAPRGSEFSVKCCFI